MLAASPSFDSAAKLSARSSSPTFAHTAGLLSWLAAISGVWYAVAFLVFHAAVSSALALLLGGLCSSAVMVALNERSSRADASFAMWGMLLALAGTLGAVVHGGYDLAAALHPEAASATPLSPVDPRGLLTFGAEAIGLAVLVTLARRAGTLPRALAAVGYAAALLSLVLYVGRLVILDPASPLIAFPALAAGFVVNPVWYIWLGVELRRR